MHRLHCKLAKLRIAKATNCDVNLYLMFFNYEFQACTGIEDLEVAILQLEEANWNLTVSTYLY